jgi:AraC family ethanolamine operon transcriptional activator
VVEAREFVSAHLTSDLSAEHTADALGVSYRVLNYAIRDSLRMSPYQYILTQKLHAVRRQLRSSEGSVAEACLSHGFSTPSRFARQYARLFGELPSETRYSGRRRSN